jgi:hypothetical protein
MVATPPLQEAARDDRGVKPSNVYLLDTGMDVAIDLRIPFASLRGPCDFRIDV